MATATSTPPVPAHSHARRRRRVLIGALAFSLLTAGVATAVSTRQASNQPYGLVAESGSDIFCPVEGAVFAQRIRAEEGVPRDEGLASVEAQGFTVDGGVKISISGQLRGAPPAQGSLWLAYRPRPESIGADDRPGDGLLHPLTMVEPDARRCFTHRDLPLSSRTTVLGIVFRVQLLAVPAEQRAEFAKAAAQSSGWRDVPAGVRPLASFDVDSRTFARF